MFTVLIALYPAFRVTLAALQRVHKSNLAAFFCNYQLTLSHTLKFHDLGTKACCQSKNEPVNYLFIYLVCGCFYVFYFCSKDI